MAVASTGVDAATTRNAGFMALSIPGRIPIDPVDALRSRSARRVTLVEQAQHGAFTASAIVTLGVARRRDRLAVVESLGDPRVDVGPLRHRRSVPQLGRHMLAGAPTRALRRRVVVSRGGC